MPSHDERLAAAHRAVLDAAQVCRHVQSALERVRRLLKDDRSPVTVADFAAQAVVVRRLHDTLGPDQIIVGEEDAAELRQQIAQGDASVAEAVTQAVRLVWPDAAVEQVLDAIDGGSGAPTPAGFWTLDPVDGTKGFLRGQQYAVSLAWLEDGAPICGALACPNLPLGFPAAVDVPDARGSLYLAARGRGVRCGGCTTGAALAALGREPRSPGDPVRVCASVERAHSSASDTERVREALGERGDPVRRDSQAKYAVVARGQADAYLRLPTRAGYVERIWDHAAGMLVASESGAVVSDMHGAALDFAHGAGLEANRGVICAEPSVHARIIDAVARLGIGAAEADAERQGIASSADRG